MRYLPFIGGAAIALGSIGARIMPPSHKALPPAADSATYTLHGTVTGLETGWVFMYHHSDGPTDSATIRQGSFELHGAVSGVEFCHLVFKTVSGNNLHSIGFFLQAGSIEATGTRAALGALAFTGAPVQDEYRQYLAGESRVIDWDGWNTAYKTAQARKNKAAIDSLQAGATTMERRQQEFAERYAADHPASYVAVEELLNYFSYNPNADTLQHLFNGLAPVIQSSYLGKELKGILDAALLTGIGRQAPAFTQADTKGRPVALSSFRGQYVLVDFWASWCGPCRRENPNVLKAWRQFHSKGFTVLGVSLDEKKDSWLAAIRQDDLPWTQVSDLKGWKNEVAVQYGVEGIPINFLLDKNGIIVAKGVQGPDLEKKLEELVH
jgi:peroxiredoxin